MERIDPVLIANTILTAPGWARAGLTAPKEQLRHEAASELARAIVDQLSSARDEPDPNQLGLAL